MTSSHTVAAFGDVMTVLHANCEFDSAGGDCAVDGQGTIHAFVAFTGKSCDQEPLITYVSGSGGSWTPAITPYRGLVIGMAVERHEAFPAVQQQRWHTSRPAGTRAIHPQPDAEPALGLGARRRSRRRQRGGQKRQVVGGLVGTGRLQPAFPSVPGVHNDLHR